MPNNFRIGFGYDIHSFTEGDHVILAGVHIPFSKKLKAHSDGDVLLHAVCDALLGAAALGDIGTHFPDKDDTYSNISSMILLEKTIEKVRNAGFTPVNIDVTVIAEAPMISPHYDEMRKNIAEKCGIDNGCVSVKATTNEKIGTIGRGEGMAATAVALIVTGNAQSLV
jgi:2-C-methyl-D-erythritol 2,4-cyclodiphosphate synthase